MHAEVQPLPYPAVECELSFSGRGGGDVSEEVCGEGVAVTGAFVCTQCTPPASPTWRGGAGKVL